MTRVNPFFALLLLCLSCAGSQQKPYSDGPVNVIYEMDGEVTELRALRGRPVVLALLRVNELSSELFIDSVVQAHGKLAGRIRFVVLTLDINEAPMLEQYAEFHELPFSVGVAQWEVAQGMTALGMVPVSPTTYLVDRNGKIAQMLPGAVSGDSIVEHVRRLGWR